MKTFLANLLIVFALSLCGMVAFQWVREARLRGDVQQLWNTISDKNDAIQGLEGEIKLRNTEIDRLEGIRTNLTATIKTNRQDIARLEKDVNRLEGDVEGQKRQLEAYKGALDTANESIKRQNDDIKQQNELLKQLADERNELVAKYNGVVTNFNGVVKEFTKLQEEYGKLLTNYNTVIEQQKKKS